jgi:hypothetical protein
MISGETMNCKICKREISDSELAYVLKRKTICSDCRDSLLSQGSAGTKSKVEVATQMSSSTGPTLKRGDGNTEVEELSPSEDGNADDDVELEISVGEKGGSKTEKKSVDII